MLWVGNVSSDLTRLLYHAWFPKPHTHISALTALALLKTTNKRYETTKDTRYPFERHESDETFFKHSSQCTQMYQVKVNVLTCDYNDFHKLAISQEKTCETNVGQIKSFVVTCDYIDHDI